MSRLLSLLLRLLPAALLLACGQGDLVLIPGTTTRVGPVSQEEGRELQLHIFREPADCIGANIAGDKNDMERLSECLPHVDRASGEVRLGYQFLDEEAVVPLPVSKEHLKVIHQGTIIQDSQEGQEYTIIPHDPQEVSQLYVLVIDGSSSMSTMSGARKTRMDQVRQALKLREVQDAFFRGEGQNGVVLAQFTSGAPQPVGGRLQILTNRQDYLQAVDQLQVLSGYTHLFDAVTYAVGPLLREQVIDSFVDANQLAITVIVLTDGFNNIKADDVCGDNARRLEGVLRTLEDIREGEGARLERRPRIFTVGLGKPLQHDFELPTDWQRAVRADDLCGRFAGRRIDGDLETLGIDNASLTWIARAGGGDSFVRQGREGLGEAFQNAAARRYNWFEVRYRVDPFYLRRSFTTRLRLTSYHSAEASVGIHPSAWLDAPPGREAKDGWTRPQQYRHTMVVLTPAVGLLIALGYVGAAVFNTRRAAFGRVRRQAGSPRR